MKKRHFLQNILGMAGTIVSTTVPPVHSKPATEKSVTLLETGFSAFHFGRNEDIFNRLKVGDKVQLRQISDGYPTDDILFNRVVDVYWQQHRLGQLPASHCKSLNQMLRRGEKLHATITRKSCKGGACHSIYLSVEWRPYV